jgi:ABC-2 type transporter
VHHRKALIGVHPDSDGPCCRRIVQYKVLFIRYLKSYWRSPPYNTTRLGLALIAALVLGTWYWSLGDKLNTPGDVLAVMGALFFSVMFIGFINFQMIIPTFFMERPVMWRERASAMYAVYPWVQSMQVCSAVTAVAPCILHFHSYSWLTCNAATCGVSVSHLVAITVKQHDMLRSCVTV